MMMQNPKYPKVLFSTFYNIYNKNNIDFKLKPKKKTKVEYLKTRQSLILRIGDLDADVLLLERILIKSSSVFEFSLF